MSTFSVGGLFFSKIGAKSVMLGVGSAYGNAVQNSSLINSVFSIPTKVTKDGITYSVINISRRSFAQSQWLCEIYIPRTITAIGELSFWGCNHLLKVTFEPGSQITIFPIKIFDLTKLAVLEIPESVVVFEKNCLFNNLNLKTITYCGNASVIAGTIYPSPKEIFVTPKFKDANFSGIAVSTRTDYVCPSLVYLPKFTYICTLRRLSIMTPRILYSLYISVLSA